MRSVAFENLGPPRLSKLLFEADLLAEGFPTMDAVREGDAGASVARRRPPCSRASRAARRDRLDRHPDPAPDGRLLRGPECKIPVVAAPIDSHEITPAVEDWAQAGWVDLREENMARWKERFERIEAEVAAIPPADSSSRFLRDRQFWGEEGVIQPGKIVGWIFATEEKGARMK